MSVLSGVFYRVYLAYSLYQLAKDIYPLTLFTPLAFLLGYNYLNPRDAKYYGPGFVVAGYAYSGYPLQLPK